MVRRIILLSVIGLLGWNVAFSCDACGCSITGSGVGMLVSYRNNFAGLSWFSTPYQASPDHGFGSKDRFQTLEFAFRFHIASRLKLLINQPYRINARTLDGETEQVSGISDTRIMGAYTLFRDVRLGARNKLFLEVGAGIKAPLGRYDAHIHDQELPENFNLGNGSWAGLLQANLVVTRQNSGLLAAGTYQYNTATAAGYRFGRQVSGQLIGFREIALGRMVSLIPNAGLTAEWVSDDHYANGNIVPGTSGSGLFASGGVNLKFNNFYIGASFAQPLAQDYSHGEVIAKSRVSCQVSYLF
ncbi:MAG TPA: hypothetical protein PKE06_27185 [Flavilitoribacter sp.]|nr:hypothetical protein [Flavilitoribacter sp.]